MVGTKFLITGRASKAERLAALGFKTRETYPLVAFR